MRRATFVFTTVLWGCWWVDSVSAEPRDERPHIVILLADDMGYGDASCFNPNSKIRTPSIDRLAREGMRFTDAHAPGPWCVPSRYGLMTGRYPFRAQLNWQKEPCIAEGRMTVASLLGSRGYDTAIVGKWHLGFTNDGWDKPLRGGPVDRGFDEFFGIRASTDIPPYYYIEGNRVVAAPTDHVAASSTPGWSPIQGAFWRAGGIAPGMKLVDVLPTFTSRAVKQIEEHHAASSDKPLFLYVAFPAPHTPWLPTAEFRGRSGADLYGDFMMMVDAMVGRILAAIDKAGMADDTLVVFTSDNGPVWYDTDVARFDHDSAGGFRGMKADAWEAGHRMPFVVRWPGKVKPNSVSSQLICHADLLATFAAIVGAELPVDAGEDSFDMSPILLGRQPADEAVRDTFLLPARRGVTIRQGSWKLIPHLGSGGFSKPSFVKPGPGEPVGQLYNLADDPGETTNLYGKHPEIVKRLTALSQQIQKAGRSRPK